MGFDCLITKRVTHSRDRDTLYRSSYFFFGRRVLDALLEEAALCGGV